MNYKELIEKLREKDRCQCECLQAATAIETLLKERDAAVEELRGICWCCAHGKKWEEAPEWSKMTVCEHMGEMFNGIACSGAKRKCQYWRWRGPKDDEKNEHKM